MRYLFSNPGRISIRRKSEAGQAQLMAALLFLFLIPTGIIIAQNATNLTNFTLPLQGNFILNTTNTSNINQTPDFPNTSQTLSNSSVFDTSNKSWTSNSAGLEQGNESIPDTEGANRTETLQKTGSSTEENSGKEQLAYLQVSISIYADLPGKVTRTESFPVFVVIENKGNLTARNVAARLILPTGVSVENDTFYCTRIEPNSACSKQMQAFADISTFTGKSKMEVSVSYE